MTKFKSRFDCGTEQTFETESYKGQEEIKWNKFRCHNSSSKKPFEILPDKNQILTKLEQFEKAANYFPSISTSVHLRLKLTYTFL